MIFFPFHLELESSLQAFIDAVHDDRQRRESRTEIPDSNQQDQSLGFVQQWNLHSSKSGDIPMISARATRSSSLQDTSDAGERTESNLAFVRRKCDEWLLHGLPKLAQLQFSIDECDLLIEKEWQPFLTDQARSVNARWFSFFSNTHSLSLSL